MSLATIPRIRSIHLPTPLQEAPRLSAALGGPRILIKRDDLTGLPAGGNKARKLEFLMADAQQKGADVIITTGSSQSNHAVQTAAAASRLGMKTMLILAKGRHPEVQGNLLLAKLLGAEVQMIDEDMVSPIFTEKMEELAVTLRRQGRHPYVISGGGASPIGCVGYVNAVPEIIEQLKEQELTANYLVVTAGTCGTIAGLLLGAKYFHAPFQIIGSSCLSPAEELTVKSANLANETALLLEMKITVSPDEITVYDQYVGEGYGIPTREGIEAMKLVLQTEGILLDPVYTGKTMAGLIDLIHQGKFTAKDTIIFLHTGGSTSVYAYANELSKELIA